MKSHHYDFATMDAVRLIGGPLVPVGVLAILMHLGATLNLLPNPRPTLDIDRTILLHQADASRTRHEANLVLIGDSSCLMDAAADQLGPALPGNHRVLNLGTLSYLDLNAYASLLRNFVLANPGQLRVVVLLMHPEALRQAAPSEYHVELLDRFLSGLDFCEPTAARLACWLGINIFKGRILSRAVPLPLSGEYGRQYGFTSGLARYLSQHQGSAIDPKKFDRAKAESNAEYRLAKRLQPASETFKAAVPPGVKLLVGITPTPESIVTSAFGQRYDAMLREWNQWLQADAVLDELPPTLPDNLFAGTTHLNEAGRRVFTETLAHSLASHLSAP